VHRQGNPSAQISEAVRKRSASKSEHRMQQGTSEECLSGEQGNPTSRQAFRRKCHEIDKTKRDGGQVTERDDKTKRDGGQVTERD